MATKLLEKHFMDAAGLMEHFQAGQGLNHIFTKIKINHLKNGKVHAEIKIEKEHLNPMGTFHGGFQSALLDTLSTAAVFNKVKKLNATVGCNISLLSSAKLGDDVFFNAAVVRAGKNLAFVDVNVVNKKNEKLICKGSFTHAILDSKL